MCSMHIFRALARIGNAYSKQEKWNEAVTYYDKSLTEHRNQDVVKKRVEVGVVTAICVVS